VDNYSIIDFIDYFTSYYYAIVPSVLLLLSVLFAFLDGARVWLLGWVDDFETTYKSVFVPWLESIFFTPIKVPKLKGALNCTDSYYGKEKQTYKVGQVLKGSSSSAYHVRVGGYWRYLVFTNKEDALAVSAYVKTLKSSEVTKLARDPDKFFSNEPKKPDTHVTFLYLTFVLFVLFLVLLAYKLLPTLTVVTVTTIASAFVVRKVVRIGKKLKAHISDPDAHKVKEEVSE